MSNPLYFIECFLEIICLPPTQFFFFCFILFYCLSLSWWQIISWKLRFHADFKFNSALLSQPEDYNIRLKTLTTLAGSCYCLKSSQNKQTKKKIKSLRFFKLFFLTFSLFLYLYINNLILVVYLNVLFLNFISEISSFKITKLYIMPT